MITSIVWTFAPVLTRRARKSLSDALKERIQGAKSDFGTYQKLKKKAAVTAAVQQDNEEKRATSKFRPADGDG